jgi:hypothetical protein
LLKDIGENRRAETLSLMRWADLKFFNTNGALGFRELDHPHILCIYSNDPD